MKKKVVVISVLVAVVLFFVCNTDKSINDENEEKKEKKIITRTGIAEGEDGWLYIVDINGEINGEKKYYIDKYNYKYREIEGYKIKVDHGDGWIEYVSDNTPGLSQNEKGREEIFVIQNHLNDIQCEREIMIEDFKEMDFTYISKDKLVEAYNAAISDVTDLTDDKEKKYMEYKAAYTEEKFLDNGTRVSVGYCIIEGIIRYVYIGVEYENSVFLKDLAESRNLTEEQLEILYDIEVIEDEIVKMNTFKVDEKLLSSNSLEIRTVLQIIEEIESNKINGEGDSK